MNSLLISPRFPSTFWSYEPILELVGKKALMPPLGLITVAALLPDSWTCRLVDCNVRPVTDAEWAWADIVLLSAMIVQKPHLLELVAEAKRRNKPVVVGGPYATALPDELRNAGADFLVLDEAELTLPPFLEALTQGVAGGTFTAGGAKPDVTTTPAPRFDLLELAAYDSMSIQFSRGCPFLCEFCDIIVLYGRRPRTKRPDQMLAEMDRLHQLGWRGTVFIVDDNFVGNRQAAKEMLRELVGWQATRGFPFHFDTEASVDLAQDQELLDLMVACAFRSVFLGIETPDAESLERTLKHQNLRQPLDEAVDTITGSGIRVMGGFVIGFDGEAAGAGSRIVAFVERTAIPTAFVSMLQALPGTALWDRLGREGRLRDTATASGNQTYLTNFAPTRPLSQVAREFVEAFERLYEPRAYLDRTWRYFLALGATRRVARPVQATPPSVREVLRTLPALIRILWRQGLARRTRWRFWHHLVSISRHNPGALADYVTVCALNEHFLVFRRLVRRGIDVQLDAMRAPDLLPAESEPAVVVS
ncbi:MAG: B12-binding domain-containing radical SAM protein [Acidobacteria bacterium]|nr:B12-binding domain-containing radical SAM protein [Acidobacteriota bacterium]